MHESQLAGKQNEHSFNLFKYRVTDYVPGKMDPQNRKFTSSALKVISTRRGTHNTRIWTVGLKVASSVFFGSFYFLAT